MIVAGVGFRSGAAAADIVGAVDDALAGSGLTRDAVRALATSSAKSTAAALSDAAARLNIPVIGLEGTALERACQATITRSQRSLEATGTPSLSEASALAALADGRLLGPRVKHGEATCALAEGKRLA
jgi:cobalt-precorrin 5A hydrolase